ncbi:MFS transporter [Streptomyces sp. 8N616]|uniref:MFS transporter n=1 Tax=Streptomyces sp. 8N616 TaxID=3457414 RepID=UPI003FD3CD8B
MSPPQSRPLDPPTSGYRWVVLAIGASAQGANAMIFLGLPAILPQLREHFRLGLPAVGLLLGSVSLGNMLALIAWGAATDRLGERPVMVVGLVGAAGCLSVLPLCALVTPRWSRVWLCSVPASWVRQ